MLAVAETYVPSSVSTPRLKASSLSPLASSWTLRFARPMTWAREASSPPLPPGLAACGGSRRSSPMACFDAGSSQRCGRSHLRRPHKGNQQQRVGAARRRVAAAEPGDTACLLDKTRVPAIPRSSMIFLNHHEAGVRKIAHGRPGCSLSCLLVLDFQIPGAESLWLPLRCPWTNGLVVTVNVW